MKGFKRVKRLKLSSKIQVDVPTSGFHYVQIQHDDWCRFWQRDKVEDCNCNPEIIAPVEVTDKNVAQVAETYLQGEAEAERLRRLAQRRN